MSSLERKYVFVTVATRQTDGLTLLQLSAKRVGIDVVVLGLNEPWRGFGTKPILVREYLKRVRNNYTHFFFVDAYDTIFLHDPIGTLEKYYNNCKLLFSTEKNCWPDAHLAPRYAVGPDGEQLLQVGSPFKYLNSGCYVGEIEYYLELVKDYPVNFEDDDQRYFTNIYFNHQVSIRLDVTCQVFQSWAFTTHDEFEFGLWNIIENKHTGGTPCVIHFNGKCIDQKVIRMIKYTSVAEVAADWRNDENKAREINETFIQKVNDTPFLNDHRTFVENNIFGFGERSFHWMWNIIVNEMPQQFSFLEIGVFKGQVLSLIKMIADDQGRDVKRYGITPLSSEGGVWESDYMRDIIQLHDLFKVKKDFQIFKGVSESEKIIAATRELELDCLYIDGGHEERHIRNDIEKYAPLVKRGGYMVIDDSCNTFSMPWGYFCGIESVTRVVNELLPPATQSNEWKFMFSVVHNRVYKRL